MVSFLNRNDEEGKGRGLERPALGPTTSTPLKRYKGSTSRAKWPGRRVDHSSQSRTEVKNEWMSTSTPPICLYGVERDSFIFQQFFKRVKIVQGTRKDPVVPRLYPHL